MQMHVNHAQSEKEKERKYRIVQYEKTKCNKVGSQTYTVPPPAVQNIHPWTFFFKRREKRFRFVHKIQERGIERGGNRISNTNNIPYNTKR